MDPEGPSVDPPASAAQPPPSSMAPPSHPPTRPHFPDRLPPPRPSPSPTHPISSATLPTPLPPRTAPSTTDHTPLPWTSAFATRHDLALPSRHATFRLYASALPASTDLCLLLLHGGGHTALSWGPVSALLSARVPVLAFDARAHGRTLADDDRDPDLSAAAQVADVAALVPAFFAEQRRPVPRLVLVGHSMGGAVAVRLAASRALPTVVGLVVIDVVEGTAMSALPYMASWLRARPPSFPSLEKAIRYVIKAGHVRNIDSARLSVPSQLVRDENTRRWRWRTDLQRSERYWKGWFQGLSSLFLSVDAAKMLVLANVDRLDKDLMIAQMQGKFQTILIPAAGHTVHEDQPEQTAHVILDYLQRNLFLKPDEDAEGGPVFQQRRPIPPCC